MCAQFHMGVLNSGEDNDCEEGKEKNGISAARLLMNYEKVA